MTDLSKLTHYVIDELRATEEYKEYEANLAELVKDRDLYYRVNEMREKNFKIQLSRNEDMMELMDALTNEYEDVINLELVRNFLDSEAAVCRLFQEFHNTVTEGLEFN
ncbi:MAG: YlbF family regulator [Lachnospiraceae bacterium]|nr:YlbF family regulator [Lachnospiraceae bacterium]